MDDSYIWLCVVSLCLVQAAPLPPLEDDTGSRADPNECYLKSILGVVGVIIAIPCSSSGLVSHSLRQ